MFPPVRLCALFAAPALLLASMLPEASRAQSDPSPPAKEFRVFDPTIIDASIDPCDNFYQFSCQGWLKNNPLPAEKSNYGRVTELEELNRLHLKQILEEVSAPNSARTPNEQKIGDEYATCMNTAAIEAQGLAPLKPEFDRIAALKNKNDLPLLLAHLHSIGVNAFFSMGSAPDYVDAAAVISSYGSGGLGLPERAYYTRTDEKSIEQRQQYVAHVKTVFHLAGETPKQATKDAEIVLRMETLLAEGSLDAIELRDPQKLNHPSDIAAIGKQLTNFRLATYVAATGVPPSVRVNVAEPRFLAAFNAAIAENSAEQIRAYLRWRLLDAFAGTSMPHSFDEENWNFNSHILNGAEKQEDRWKRCTSHIDNELGEALGQVYVARYFSASDKQRTLEMALAIEAAMEKDIDALDWMSPATKVRAKEKLHAVMNKVGYPDRWRDYSALQIVRDDAIGNQSRANVFEYQRGLAKVGKPVDKGEWSMTPPTVNAYYDGQQNNVNFPAGYLQPPFFNGKEDDAANYGNMGSTIGHELTHGFDDEGRQFDATGNLKDWWTKDDELKFSERSNCVVKEYDAIESVPDVHLSGKLTLGENLADLGGLWLSWLAWLDKASAVHLNMAAKTDGYTPDQRFWIAYAQQWCTQERPEELRTLAQTDPHSPSEHRTNAVLQNLPEFTKSFSCKPSSKMISANRCRVW